MLRLAVASAGGALKQLGRHTVARHLSCPSKQKKEDVEKSSGLGLEGLVENLQASNPITNKVSPGAGSSLFKDVENVTDFGKTLMSLRTLTPAQAVEALHTALHFPDDRHMATTAVLEMWLVPAALSDGRATVHETLSAMTALVQLRAHNSPLMDTLSKHLESVMVSDESGESAITALLPLLAASKGTWRMPESLMTVVETVVTARIMEISQISELLSLLNYFDSSSRPWLMMASRRAVELLPVMSLAETTSVCVQLAARRHRDPAFLKLVGAHISGIQQPLTVNQLASLSAACVKLYVYDMRIQRKVAHDLVANITNLSNWNDASGIVDSLARWRQADPAAWSALSNWLESNLATAPMKHLSVVVSAMARLGIKNEVLAKQLAKVLRADRAGSEHVWLTAVHALAFHGTLTSELAESVLRKEFVHSIMNDPKNVSPASKIYLACKLLQVDGAVSADLPGYSGQRCGKQELAQWVDVDRVLPQASMGKFGAMGEAAAVLFRNCVHRIAPISHSMTAHLNADCGAVVDAMIVPDAATGRMIPVAQWKDKNPIAFLYFGWAQQRMFVDSEGKKPEEFLLGGDQLSLRLLRRKGVIPCVVLHSAFEQLGSDKEKLDYLKERIKNAK